MTEIESATGTHRNTIRRQLIASGIDIDKDVAESYQKKLEQVVKLYQDGKSQLYIEQTLNLTRKTIREYLKSIEIKYKTKSEQWLIRYRNTDLREDAFEIITPESAYWLGMLYTDGHIGGETARGYNIELSLQRGDRDHIQKFKDYMKTNSPIEDHKPAGRLASRVRIGSERIHKSLKALGFTNEKSYDAIPHESLQNSRDFWRGCIDGDGGVYCKDMISYKTHQLYLCGTIDTVGDFITFCEQELELKNKKSPTKCTGKCLYEVSYYGQEASKITDLLYKDATTFLDRKYETYQKILTFESKSIDNFNIRILLKDDTEIKLSGTELKELLIEVFYKTGTTNFTELNELSKRIFIFGQYDNWTDEDYEEIYNYSL